MAAPTHGGDEVISFGCRLNIAESETIRALLARQPADRRRVVVNGCAVTGEAMRQARAAVRRARRNDPDAIVIASGCAAQVDPAGFAAMPEVDRVLGNREKLDGATLASGAQRVAVGDLAALARTAPQYLGAYSQHARGFLEVQNGCDHSCTFCVIPQGRGPSRSTPIVQAVAAAQRLVAAGHRELVLTGVDLTSWGHDLPGAPRLGDLIAALLDDVPGLERVRLGSIDPAEVDPLLFALLTQEARMMPHLHLSLQAGDDLILKRMKRRHARADAVALVARLKAARPAIAIGADLIAGFPTEDDAAFANTAAVLDDCDVVFAHIFPYSPRGATPAARMPQVDPQIRKARAASLRAAAMARRHRWLDARIGTTTAMLVELDGRSGHANDFARVRLSAPAAAGTILTARITGRDGDELLADRIA